MGWLDNFGTWVMQHPVASVFIVVLLLGLLVWLEYIEEKWR